MAIARKKTAVKQPKPQTLEILEQTEDLQEQKATGTKPASDSVFIACGLPLGIKFDDVDNGHGGLKAVTFPGVNNALRGKATGVLLPAGNAVLVEVARSDWEDIKRKHGRESYFLSEPPLLMELASRTEFKARKDEIAEMRSGVEPVDPTKQGVEVATRAD